MEWWCEDRDTTMGTDVESPFDIGAGGRRGRETVGIVVVGVSDGEGRSIWDGTLDKETRATTNQKRKRKRSETKNNSGQHN